MTLSFPGSPKSSDKRWLGGRISPFSLIASGVLLLAIFALSGCETAASKKARAPQPLPGRSSKQAIQSRHNPAMLTGKSNVIPEDPNSPPPPPVFAWPEGFDRVAALPIYSTTPTGGAIQDLDEIFRGELSKLLPFEVVPISRAELIPIIGENQIASTSIIPPKLVQYLKTKYAVQGIVFTDMPLYRPYRPINIAVRSKLAQTSDMQILWSASGILDSSEPGIAASALQYADRNLHGPGSGDSQLILQSPRRYAAFVANGLYGTLPGLPTAPGRNHPGCRRRYGRVPACCRERYLLQSPVPAHAHRRQPNHHVHRSHRPGCG
ncbi:MAG: hypothetical protein WCS65_11255 [Verrucomicrobiae bacterium]